MKKIESSDTPNLYQKHFQEVKGYISQDISTLTFGQLSDLLMLSKEDEAFTSFIVSRIIERFED